MKKAIAISALLIGALLMAGCSSPSPQQYLNAGVIVLNDLSTLPNLTPADKAWLAAGAVGFQCSAGVLAAGVTGLQAYPQIALCFTNLPIVPANERTLISTGISVVQVFIALFGGPAAPAVSSADQTVIKNALAASSKTMTQADVQKRVQIIRSRLGK